MTKYLKLKITVVLCILLAEIVTVGSLVYIVMWLEALREGWLV